MNGVEELYINNSEIVGTMFDEAPVVDGLELDFDQAVERIVDNPTDTEAFTVIRNGMEQARIDGNLSLVYERAMVLGAMACLCENETLQNFSNDITNKYVFNGEDGDDHEGHNHGPEQPDDKTDDKNKKKKKRKKKRF